MAAARDQPLELSADKSAAGSLALQIEERERRLDEKHLPRKTEVVLAGAGLTSAEIAALMGKEKGAVAKAITRSRAKRKARKRANKTRKKS
jgi:DNA-directed RNA polymerase specialized sigma24 family protein